MEKSVEYGIRTPKSDFDRRPNDTNAPSSKKVKGTKKKSK